MLPRGGSQAGPRSGSEAGPVESLSAARRAQVKLAVSLHAANDAARDKIMPVNTRFPIKVWPRPRPRPRTAPGPWAVGDCAPRGRVRGGPPHQRAAW